MSEERRAGGGEDGEVDRCFRSRLDWERARGRHARQLDESITGEELIESEEQKKAAKCFARVLTRRNA